MRQFLFAASAIALTMAACSPDAGQSNAIAPENTVIVEETNIIEAAPVDATRNVVVEVPPPAARRVLGLEGLGDLRIGAPIPKGSNWAERGAQAGDACRTVSSPDYAGVYAIVTDGKVRRITVGQRSDVKLVEGIGAGASESDVKKWFAGFREEPHKYEDAPAKYLTAPNAKSGDPALRFEIGRDGKVSMMHVGTMPVLGYVEGCS